MAMTLYATNIYSNNGSKLLWQGCLEKQLTITITSDGLTIIGGDQFTGVWGYHGSGTFLGLATSSGATTPTYAIGDSLTTALSTLDLYIVENGGTVSKTLNVTYNNNIIISSPTDSNLNKTLKCNDKVMLSDVNVSIT